MSKKNQARLFLILGGFPLVIYPCILFANLAALDAVPLYSSVPMIQTIAAYGFLWSSIIYPALYIPFAITTLLLMRKRNYQGAALLALIPLIGLAIILLLLILWILIT